MCLNHFLEEYDPTIEDSYRKLVQVDGTSCVLEVLDTAGQEEYASMLDLYIRGTQGFLLVYDITSRVSIGRIRQFYTQVMRIKENEPDSPPSICLVGNKSDKSSEREVSSQEGFALAKELDCLFFESSSKELASVEACFFGLVREIRTVQADRPDKAEDRPQPPKRRSSRLTSLASLFRSPKSQVTEMRSRDLEEQMHLNRLLVKTAQRDKAKTARDLLEQGADPNGDPGADGSPLYAAAALGHTKMVTLLIESGAAVNARSIRGATPLMVAAAEGHLAVVEILLARGASTDVHSDNHGTPLIAATFRCHLKVLSVLLLHGAKVNERGGQYDTALHTVATIGNEKVTRLLLEAGADASLRDRYDCTTLQVAAAAGHAEVVRLLLLRGAHLLIDDTRGRYGSALRAANDRSRFDVMKILLNAGAKEETLNVQPPQIPAESEGSRLAASSFGSLYEEGLAKKLDDNPSTDEAGTLSSSLSNSGHILAGQGLSLDEISSEITSGAEVGEQRSAEQTSSQHVSTLAHGLTSEKETTLHNITAAIDVRTSNVGHRQLVANSPADREDETWADVAHHNYSGSQRIPWKLISRLGQGSCSVVEEVQTTVPALSGMCYARKTFALAPRARRRLLLLIQNEVDILKTLHHHHITQIHSTYYTEREFAIIMTPVADMNLEDYLAYNRQPTADSPIYSWFGCLATAFNYLHERKIKHQDVKPANILIRNGQIVIADFGISKSVLNEATTGSIGPTAKTLMYCAPEVASQDSSLRRGRAADMFSLGCVFLEMVTALLWAHGCSVEKLHDVISSDDRRIFSASSTNILQWILMLYTLSSIRPETSLNNAPTKIPCTPALQWCLAMLLDDPVSRITASELKAAIDSYQAWRSNGAGFPSLTANPSWIGYCCFLEQHEEQEALLEPRVMKSWPALTLDAVSLGYNPWHWDDVKRRMSFRT